MATSGLYGSSPTGALIAQPGTETPGLYGKSPNGSVVAQPGSESAGLYGNSTNFGGTYFEWFVFQESATAPATPTGGSWNFLTNTGTAPTGWSSTPPISPTNTVWASISIVNSRNTAALVWSTPASWVKPGTPGSTGPTGPIGNTGPTGPYGPTGPQGQGLQLDGSVATPANLPPTGQPGDQYFVQSTKSVFIWSNT
jgi:hypothetical protein